MTQYDEDDDDDSFYSAESIDADKIDASNSELLHLKPPDVESQFALNAQKIQSLHPMLGSIRISTLQRGFDTVKDEIQKIQTKEKECKDDIGSMDETEDNESLLWHRYDLRENGCAHYLVDRITSKMYHICLYICILVAIFIEDIEHSMKYRPLMDVIVDYIILVIFSILICDILLCCLVYRNYLFSFLWFLETFGTFSLLYDFNSILLVPERVKRTIHTIQILAFLRFSRIIKIITITKLSRLSNIIQDLRDSFGGNPLSEMILMETLGNWMPNVVNNSINKTQNNIRRISTDIQTAAIRKTSGATFSLFEKIMVALLVLLCSVSLLSGASNQQYQDVSLVKNVLIEAIKDANLKPQINDIVSTVLLSSSNIFYLEIDGKIYKNDKLRHQNLRDLEIFHETGDYNLKILVDISKYTRFEHEMNVGYSILVIVIFAIVIFGIIFAIDKIVFQRLKALSESIGTNLLYPAMFQSNLIEPVMNQIAGQTKQMVAEKVQSKFRNTANKMKKNLMLVGLASAAKDAILRRAQQN